MNITIIIPTWSPGLGVQRAIQHLSRATSLRTQAVVLSTGDGMDPVPDMGSGHRATNPNATAFVSQRGAHVHHGRPQTLEALLPTPAMAIGAAMAGLRVSEWDWEEEILLFLHDDVRILDEGWDGAIIEHFINHPRSGLVGFGGAMGFADSDIYRTPYRLQQLQRHSFLSNMEGWEEHGGRLEEPQRAAVLDGFALAIRRPVYDAIGGWDACARAGIHFHMYDAWLSVMVQLTGWEVCMLPVRCSHEGGGTSVKKSEQYERAVKRAGYESGQDLYDRAHERIYEMFRGALPISW